MLSGENERDHAEHQLAYPVSRIMQYYVRQDKPLDGLYIFHVLEPLVGTSFMNRAIQEMRFYIEERRLFTDKGIYPNDLLTAFFGGHCPDQMKEVQNAMLQEEATIAIHSLSPSAIGLDIVLTLDWLETDEMLLYQIRWDDVYLDTERTQKAFTHTSVQWQFYKAGHYLHTIANSRITYQDEQGKFHLHALLPDGFYDSSFFIDGRRRPFTGLSHRQQGFRRGRRMLYISPRFSFDAARRK